MKGCRKIGACDPGEPLVFARVDATQEFPHKAFSFVPQTKRAAASVPSKVADGPSSGKKLFGIAPRTLEELGTEKVVGFEMSVLDLALKDAIERPSLDWGVRL